MKIKRNIGKALKSSLSDYQMDVIEEMAEADVDCNGAAVSEDVALALFEGLDDPDFPPECWGEAADFYLEKVGELQDEQLALASSRRLLKSDSDPKAVRKALIADIKELLGNEDKYGHSDLTGRSNDALKRMYEKLGGDKEKYKNLENISKTNPKPKKAVIGKEEVEDALDQFMDNDGEFKADPKKPRPKFDISADSYDETVRFLTETANEIGLKEALEEWYEDTVDLDESNAGDEDYNPVIIPLE